MKKLRSDPVGARTALVKHLTGMVRRMPDFSRDGWSDPVGQVNVSETPPSRPNQEV